MELTALSREMLADTNTPVSAYLKLCGGGKVGCLLESAEITGDSGRYSFVAWDPLATLTLTADGARFDSPLGSRTEKPQDFFRLLKEARGELSPDLPGGLPFVGSLVGYIGWETASILERLPFGLDPDHPTAQFFYPGQTLVFDHLRRIITLVALGRDEGECRAKLEETTGRLGDRHLSPPMKGSISVTPAPARRYMDAVEKAKEYIRAGDIFQVVPSDVFIARGEVDPFSVYRWLRVGSPSPYMFHLDFGNRQLVGSSPETLVKVGGGVVTLKPIAGTRGRGKTPVRDKDLEQEMLASEKERAEHLMLVDLGRNDAGRVSEYGTVKVDPYMKVERFSHVMHMVSEVRGALRPDMDEVDAFTAAFPAGTVSGAPKVRAMEIIDELEEVPRGPYGGAVGYFGPGGGMDTCLAIRIINFQDGEIIVRAGGGIVADSDPRMEYKEICNKAAQSLLALERAARGEM